MTLILTALLGLLPAAAAEEPAVSTAAVVTSSPAAQIPLPARQTKALHRLIRDINLLLEQGGTLPPDKAEEFYSATAALDGKVRGALDQEVLKEADLREEIERVAAAKKTLAALRAALQAYYAASNGKYPAAPSELVPLQLPEIPELELPGHQASAAVTIIDSKKFDKNLAKALTDSGSWLYFSSPESANYGLLLIDCTHREPDGEELSNY